MSKEADEAIAFATKLFAFMRETEHSHQAALGGVGLLFLRLCRVQGLDAMAEIQKLLKNFPMHAVASANEPTS